MFEGIKFTQERTNIGWSYCAHIDNDLCMFGIMVTLNVTTYDVEIASDGSNMVVNHSPNFCLITSSTVL